MLRLLQELHAERNCRPVVATLHALVAETRALTSTAFWPCGDQALRNIAYVFALARDFDTRSHGSFRAFLEAIDEQAVLATRAAHHDKEPPPSSGVARASAGVSILTVDDVRGLEFPVVVVADPTAPDTPRETWTFVDVGSGLAARTVCGAMPNELMQHAHVAEARARERATRQRYVAMSRACDVLVLPIIGDSPKPEALGWLDALDNALYPKPQRRRDSEPAPGCPRFGDDSVAHRPVQSTINSTGSIRPGLHRSGDGGHAIVVWDPRVLPIDPAPGDGQRHQKSLVLAPSTAQPSESSAQAFATWQHARAKTLEEASRPSFSVERDSTIAPVFSDGWLGRNIPGTDDDAQRLCLGVLRSVRLDSDSASLRDAIVHHARDLGLRFAEREIDAVHIRIGQALQHTYISHALCSSHIEQGAPLVACDTTPGPQSTPHIFESIVDLAWLESASAATATNETTARDGFATDGWVIAAFVVMSPGDVTRSQEMHRAQRRLEKQVAAMRQATGLPTRGILIEV